MAQTVQTSINTIRLPPLPLSDVRSSSSPTTPARPRTDLRVFRRWDLDAVIRKHEPNFEKPFHKQFQLSTEAFVGGCSDEQQLMSRADISLHYVLVKLLAAMGVHGLFKSVSGNKHVVGAPDRVWILADTRELSKPKLVIEFKTPWAFRFENLLSHWDQHKNNDGDKVVRAISQLYGYMTFNNLRYGALTTYEKTWFFKRTNAAGGGCLEVAGPYKLQDSAALLKAYLAVLLEVDEDWFHVSPTASPSPPTRGQFQAQQLDLDLGDTVDITDISFGQGRDRSRMGCVVEGTFQGEAVVMKVVDETKHIDLAEELRHEAEQYKLMSDLDCIPRLKGLAEVWHMLLVLIMEPAGRPLEDAILEEQQRAARNVPPLWGGVGARHGAMRALENMHAKGLVHGDVKLENIMFDTGTGQVKLIDFGFTKPGGRDEQKRELKYLNELLLEAEERAAQQVAEGHQSA